MQWFLPNAHIFSFVNHIVLVRILFSNVIPNIFSQFLMVLLICSQTILDFIVRLHGFLYFAPKDVLIIDFEITAWIDHITDIQTRMFISSFIYIYSTCKGSQIVSEYIWTMFNRFIMIAHLALYITKCTRIVAAL